MIFSCSKEKFNNEGKYEAIFTSQVQYNEELKEIVTTIDVALRDETKTTIQWNEILLEKKGRSISGILPTGILWQTKEVQIDLERDLFGTDINGVFETETFYIGRWRSTNGEIVLTHVN
jgi:hypothetical protein